ncbi:acetolactate synthase small subunit [soil metagenome]
MSEPAMTAPAGAPATPVVADRYVPGSGERQRHLLVVLVNDRPGVLNRVASLLRSRDFNIESLAVGHSERAGVSRMTIVFHGDDFAVEQVSKQLYRLIDVLKVQDLSSEQRIEHELALIKVRASRQDRAEALKVVELYKARVVDLGAEHLIVEATGTVAEIDAVVTLLAGFGIKELVRTGAIAMARGPAVIRIEGGR